MVSAARHELAERPGNGFGQTFAGRGIRVRTVVVVVAVVADMGPAGGS